MYPDIGLTKLELAEFYANVAERMLPHVAGRPLSVIRCPYGLDVGAVRLGVHQSGRGSHGDTHCFFQKHAARTPAPLGSTRVPEKAKMATYLCVRDAKDLVTLVQFGTLELHPWGARSDMPDCPDRMIFDLDPAPDVAWSAVVEAARAVRRRLDALGLASWLKTTGGKGLHVVVPLVRRNGWDDVKSFSRAIADAMSREEPDKYVATVSLRRRGGRILVDWLRNARGSTAVAPFSTRARPGAPVSTPIRWSELGPHLRPDTFHVRDVVARLHRLRRDPWEGFDEARQQITRAMLAEVGIG
jgi:bifunctional non-homologous end joining protein LigD